MSCCNKAPNGGSRQLGALLKFTLCIFIGLALMVVAFG
ncbi:hypothetical protein VIBRN418_07816 [Vibrio sp. N418]|uniref:Uncharacterized protein n=2 Tax=Vibrio scophthalmi TaxID=45658 RepID=F9RUX1_9VIBR|nr:hypothetical protein VIS19158_15544 [Vibrio scophthalmi LMG 19158]EGU36622.1 hypothetical protein VIBRN418_07816 [Vibrio sp. N418]ODS11063.1 hypothetical protein VSF3289_01324 [Vibrio scophthalmi]